MTIGKKLILGFMAIAMLIGVVGIMSFHAGTQVKKLIDHIAVTNIREMETSTAIAYSVQRIKSNIREIFLETGAEDTKDVLYAKNVIKKRLSEVQRLMPIWEEAIKDNFKFSKNEDFSFSRNETEELRAFQRLKTQLESFTQSVSRLLIIHEKEGLEGAKDHFEDTVEPLSREIQEVIKFLEDDMKAEMAFHTHEIADLIRNTTIFGLVTTFFAFLAAISLGSQIAHSISKRLTQLRDAAASIGEGNLNERIPVQSQDELGDLATSFNKMADNIQEKTTKLKKQNADLKKVELMKNEFISIVSHELRTPLTSIRGSLGLIAGGATGPVSEQVKPMVDIALNNCERLVRLINDILDIEKIESGKARLMMNPLKLMPLLEHAIEANRSYAKQFDVELRIDKTLSGVMVNADSDSLIQVLTNLLSNAVKFSPPKSTVDVSVTRKEGSIRVTVTDHGSGIPEEFHKRIFQRFSQADSTDTRKKGGTGLGLSIAKALVERMGGKIGFETKMNHGTTFHFDLPEWREGKVLVRRESSHKPRILICEDDCDVATLISMLLQREGFDTDIAYDAMGAKRLLAKNQYVGMTLDIVLPDEDGISLIRELRRQKETQDIPIIIISAKAETARKEIGGSVVNMVDWLQKPIDTNRLLSAVKMIKRRQTCERPAVLHVEDDEDTSKVISAMLKNIADVSGAATLYEAKQKLKADKYNLIILDVGLPDGSGFELLPLLNGHNGPPTPVVIFSAYENNSSTAQNIAATLVKSRTSNEEFMTTIKALLNPENGEKHVERHETM